MSASLSLFDRVWARHVIVPNPGGEELLFVDRNLVHDGSTFLAFDQMRSEGRTVRKPKQTLAVTDHYVPSAQRATAPASIANAEIRRVVELLDINAREFGIEHYGVHDARQGIIHVIGPELGWTQPGLLIACCDSHTATHGALGALPIPIGQSNQLRHVLATQTVWQKKPKTLRITIDGVLPAHVSAKDVILAIIARIGIGGAVGHAVEYAGSTIRAMSIEGRMTICNMSIEAGARIGMIAPDDTTYTYLHGRPFAPNGNNGADWDRALAYWRTLPSDADARFDRELSLNASELAPMVSWGTSPEDSSPISDSVPEPASVTDAEKRGRVQRALDYMKLAPGTPLASIKIDRVFIGSCTNARIEDLRAAAAVIQGRRATIPAMVVPGSTGALGAAGQRCASPTNRNFEGRQGPGALTHIMSPAMAAAAAVTGHLTDVRTL